MLEYGIQPADLRHVRREAHGGRQPGGALAAVNRDDWRMRSKLAAYPLRAARRAAAAAYQRALILCYNQVERRSLLRRLAELD